MRGTRERRHHHYLKGILVCGVCGRRLSIQYSKGIYTYFYCLGQKDRRNGTGCRERYVVADQLEAEVEDLYGRIEVPDEWAEGLREAIAAEVATHHEDTTAERVLLTQRREHADAERFKLMEAYYANAIDVTMLRREQDRSGAELLAIESRQATLDASLEDWQEVMDLALRFSTRCATAYRRAGDRTRKLLNTAVLDQIHVRDGHVVEAAYKEPLRPALSLAEVRIRRCGGPGRIRTSVGVSRQIYSQPRRVVAIGRTRLEQALCDRYGCAGGSTWGLSGPVVAQRVAPASEGKGGGPVMPSEDPTTRRVAVRRLTVPRDVG